MTSEDAVGASDSEGSAIYVVEAERQQRSRGPGLYSPILWIVVAKKFKKPMWRSLAHTYIDIAQVRSCSDTKTGPGDQKCSQKTNAVKAAVLAACKGHTRA